MSNVSYRGAISYSLLYKSWQAGAGIVTIPVVVHFLAPAAQGYYYTFASLIALQSFFELGMSIVISVYASHEWHKLHLDERGLIAGDASALSKLVSLGRFIFKYFGSVSLGYLVCAGLAGYFVLRGGKEAGLDWLGPWFLHVLFSAGCLWLLPFLSLLEGCNQVAHIAKFRLFQSLTTNLALWVALAAGGELWSLPISSFLGLGVLALYLGIFRRRFFGPFFRAPRLASLSWRNDLLPMQWRLAVQALFGYLSFPLYTILVYHYSGPTEAGRIGMTLQVIAGIQSFSLVFMVARAPEFALLAASGQATVLLQRWSRACLVSLGVMVLASAAVYGGMQIAAVLNVPQISRMLTAGLFAELAAGAVLAGAVVCISIYLRAHKRELLTPVGVMSGIAYGLSAWYLCIRAGSGGVIASYLMVTALVALPLTLLVFRAHYPRLRQQRA